MRIEKKTHITTNSKKVKTGSIFVSINNNHDYIKEAIAKKASLIISEKPIESKIVNIVVNNIKYFFSYYYQKINNIKIDDFTVIGVTGTDGKTTISKMIYDTITERYPALCIGTNGVFYKEIKKESNNTTPDIEEILECFLIAKNENIRYIILEVSSEGILAKRLTGIKFDIIIFSNLSHEHLNTHHTMENYFKTKKKALKLLKKKGRLITNIEDFYGKKLSNETSINYGLNKGKIHTLSIYFKDGKTHIFLINDNKIFFYIIPFIGIYNIYNFLAAFGCIQHLFNINLFTFKNLTPPEGRFIKIQNVIIDFAHTPNALENLLLTIKETYQKDIILVIGSQGGKDKSKRKTLGSVADKYAKEIILTSEDPKDESLIQIIFDISLGIINSPYTIEFSRKKAIDKALKLSSESNIIVIVGKGTEKVEKHKGYISEHNDYKYVCQQIKINQVIFT